VASEYTEYAKVLNEISIIERRLSESRLSARNLKDSILSVDKDGSIGLTVSDHAFAQMSIRIHELASDNPLIYKDVFPDNLDGSLLVPNNLKSFIISMMAKALEDNSRKSRKSRGEGVEYIYTLSMNCWSTEDSLLQFVAIVENNIVKTGYFNWVSQA